MARTASPRMRTCSARSALVHQRALMLTLLSASSHANASGAGSLATPLMLFSSPSIRLSTSSMSASYPTPMTYSPRDSLVRVRTVTGLV